MPTAIFQAFSVINAYTRGRVRRLGKKHAHGTIKSALSDADIGKSMHLPPVTATDKRAVMSRVRNTGTDRERSVSRYYYAQITPAYQADG